MALWTVASSAIKNPLWGRKRLSDFRLYWLRTDVRDRDLQPTDRMLRLDPTMDRAPQPVTGSGLRVQHCPPTSSSKLKAAGITNVARLYPELSGTSPLCPR